MENEVPKQASEKIEDESHSLNWNYIIFAMIAGIFVVEIILKVSIEKYRNKSRSRGKWKRKNIRKKWR